MATKKKASKGGSKGKGSSKAPKGQGKGKTKAKATSKKRKIKVSGKKGLDGTPITAGGDSGS